MSDADELIRRARSGTDDALARLVEECRPTVRDYLRARVGAGLQRYVSLSDMEQDVLLGGVQALDRLAPDASIEDFRALLLQHARWAVGKAARGRRRFDGESQAPDTDGPPPRTLRSGAVTRADELRWLGEHVSELPEPERDVVVRRLAGATFESIASELGLSESAVRKRYLLAARKLRAAGR